MAYINWKNGSISQMFANLNCLLVSSSKYLLSVIHFPISNKLFLVIISRENSLQNYFLNSFIPQVLVQTESV